MFSLCKKIISVLSMAALASIILPAAGLTKTAMAQTDLLLQNSTNNSLIIKPLVGSSFSQFSLKPGEKMVKDLGMNQPVMDKETLLVMMHMTNSCQGSANCKPINCEMGLYTQNGRNINIRVYNGDPLCAGYLRISYKPTFSS